MKYFQSKAQKQKEFWEWFIQSKDRISAFPANQTEEMGREIFSRLKRIGPGLSFEISSKIAGELQEFVVSAKGMKDKFEMVEDVVASAPEVEGWIIIKFRQRRELGNLKISGFETRNDDIFFLLSREEGGLVGIKMFFKGYSEEKMEMFAEIGFLFLDFSLGEYDVATRVGSVDFFAIHTDEFDLAKPIDRLAEEFDKFCLPDKI